ncbi:MAG: 3-isopropylmalate dehydratase small subunit, partial [Gammaproteobacteria bacterium]|nr:3-isopropylmalate dehydratase small subunit [Gammaproteobacteria bacterium]
PSQTITTPDGEKIPFEIEDSRKNILLNGLDDISMTLQNEQDIQGFEASWKQKSPWLFSRIN